MAFPFRIANKEDVRRLVDPRFKTLKMGIYLPPFHSQPSLLKHKLPSTMSGPLEPREHKTPTNERIHRHNVWPGITEMKNEKHSWPSKKEISKSNNIKTMA